MAVGTLKLVFIAVIACCLCQYAVGNGTKIPPKYVINLDLPDEERWTHIMKDYHQVVKDVQLILRKYIPEFLLPVIEMIAGDLDKYLPSPFAGEMRGIATTLNISLGDIVGMNILYDVTAFCTSIISQDMQGRIWHSRNLDYAFGTILRNLTVFIDFQRGGKTAYSSITYAGYVGSMTGQKPNAFTITVDERDQGAWWENAIIALLDRDTQPVSFLVREIMDMDLDFAGAVERISFTVTAASAYFIVGGVKPGEGAVITKGRLDAIDVWYIDWQENRWFVVETNYDHWKPPPAKDDRRDPAIKAMNAMGNSSISVNNLFKVMSTPPVLNDKTTYTVVMRAADPGLMTAWIRE